MNEHPAAADPIGHLPACGLRKSTARRASPLVPADWVIRWGESTYCEVSTREEAPRTTISTGCGCSCSGTVDAVVIDGSTVIGSAVSGSVGTCASVRDEPETGAHATMAALSANMSCYSLHRSILTVSYLAPLPTLPALPAGSAVTPRPKCHHNDKQDGHRSIPAMARPNAGVGEL